VLLTLNKRERGVIMTPKKLPKTELNMAAVSLPCAARVRITALETGGGMHATVMRLSSIHVGVAVERNSPLQDPRVDSQQGQQLSE
jgi:hypothetical protein